MQEKPQPGMAPMKEETIRIIPFKVKRDRKFMPFKVGQGVSLAGWQFEVASCLPNGNVVLKPRGMILTPQVEAALDQQMKSRVEELNFTQGQPPQPPAERKMPVYDPAEVQNAKKPDAE